MPEPIRTRLTLLAAFAASVALHAVAVAALVRSPGGAPVFDADRAIETNLASPGIESSSAATITWIGFQDPSPHSAPRAETDQAQVSPNAGESSRVVAASAAVAAGEALRQAARQVADASERLAPVLERGTVLAEALRDQATVAARRQAAEEAARRAAEAREARLTAEGDRPALPDERDAAATSTEPTLVYEAGRPLARQGLQIVPVRPKFDAATRAIERPRGRTQPVVRITFNRDGTVRDVSFVDGGTGISAIDEPIKTAVYRWTASGSDLDALPAGDPDATLSIRIRFDL